MSNCNCGSGNHFHEYKGNPYGPEHINHMFDPNPPAFYGTWNRLYGYDPSDRVSMTQPGISTGLYRLNGCLHCHPCHGNITMLTGVSTTAKISLLLNFNYTNSNCNASVELTPGKIYTVKYLENGTIKGCTGLVTNIYKVDQLNEEQAIYKIRFDCSANYSNNVVVIKSDQIRELKEYIAYQDEDNTLSNASHTFGTTLGRIIENAVLTDVELDPNKNILKGRIIEGKITDGRTVDGIIVGTNSSGHKITLLYGQTSGGVINDGIVLSGILRKGEVSNGTVNEETGFTSNAIVKGLLTDCMIANSKVYEASTVDNCQAVVIDPTLKNGTLSNAIISGPDMITIGGVTVGDITTGGIVIGGTPSGGIAKGYINNEHFTIINGITTSQNSTPITNQEMKSLLNHTGTNTKEGILNTGVSNINTTGKLITQGAVVKGGTLLGGTKMGNAIYGGIVTGGTATGGVTTGGITTGGTLIPGFIREAYEQNFVYDKEGDSYIINNPPWSHENNWYGWYKKTDDLLLMTDKETNSEIHTNLGKAAIAYPPAPYGHPYQIRH